MPRQDWEGSIPMNSPDHELLKSDGSADVLSGERAELECLFNLSLEMLCIADTTGYFRRLNAAFHRVLGYDLEELLSRPFVEFVHPEDRQRTLEEVGKLSEGVPTVHFENRYRCKDGSYRWLAWSAMPDEEGELLYATASDITDAKRSEHAFRRSEHRYQELLAAVTSCRYSVSLKNGLPVSTEHTLGCQATTGYSPEEYAADPYLWINMVHPEDRQTVRDQVAHVLRREHASPLEHRILHKDGRIRWVRNTVVPHSDNSGLLAKYDGLVEDITDRKRTEQRFKQLLESAPDAMVIVDEAGQIVLVNQQTEQLFGYSREGLLGRPIEILVPERFRDRHPRDRAAYVAKPDIRPIGTSSELYALRKDGSEFLAEIRLSPLATDEGTLISSAVRDITERKRMEQSLREREAQLLAAKRIQQHLLPQRSPEIPCFEIAGASYPADFVGGDYFDYLQMPDGSTGIVIADVTGHGLPAALLASSTHTLFRSLANHHQEIPDILRLANSMLMDETEADLFVTAILGRLDSKSRSFVYASAGHPPAYLLNKFGDVKACLESTAPLLGVLGESDFPTGGPYVLDPGDVLLLVTDGIIEAMTAEGEYFGTARMLEVVRSKRHLAAGEIVASLYKEVCEFVYPAKATDDVTAVVVRCSCD